MNQNFENQYDMCNYGTYPQDSSGNPGSATGSATGTATATTTGSGTGTSTGSGSGSGSGSGTRTSTGSGNKDSSGNQTNIQKKGIDIFDNLHLHAIFLLILIISSNFLTEMFTCDVRDFCNSNVYIKNLFAFLSMIFFVVLATPDVEINFQNIMLRPFLLYLGFMIITKVNVTFFVIIFIYLFIIYLLHLKKRQIQTNANKPGGKKPSAKQVLMYTHLDIFLNVSFMLIVLVGVLVHIGEKKIELGDRFSLLKFIMAETECGNKNGTKLQIKDYIKRAVS
jgi:hypothetical protein